MVDKRQSSERGNEKKEAKISSKEEKTNTHEEEENKKEEEERKKGGRQKVKRRKGIKEICRNLTVSGSSGASSFRQKNSINGIKQERC